MGKLYVGNSHCTEYVMFDYYDLVLGLVPATLVSVTGLLSAFGTELYAAVPVGAGLAALVVAHALFVNGPTPASTPPSTPASTPTPAADSARAAPAPAAD